MTARVPAIKVLLLPKDTNALGTIFGGVILSHVDLASAVEARKVAPHRYVTKVMRDRIGRTSVTVGVTVEVERWGAGHGECETVTEAEVVLVAVGMDGRPIPIVPAPAAEAR